MNLNKMKILFLMDKMSFKNDNYVIVIIDLFFCFINHQFISNSL